MIYLWKVFVLRCVFLLFCVCIFFFFSVSFFWLGMLMLEFKFIRVVVHIMNSMKSNFLLWLHAHSLTRPLFSSKTITSNVVQQVSMLIIKNIQVNFNFELTMNIHVFANILCLFIVLVRARYESSATDRGRLW